jgi:HEAT repeat protein
MIAAWIPALLGLVAGDFAWPGALQVDGRALAALPGAERPAAVERLVARHGIAAAAPYLRPLLSDPEPEVRVYVGRLLARAGDRAALEAAVGWLTTPGQPPVDRSLALDVLSHVAPLTPEARRAIEQAVRDRDPVVRMRGLEALGRQDPAASFSVVLGALDDESREVRQQAALLVALTARARPGDANRTTEATLPLLERLGDADRLIRLAALRALGSLQDPRAIPALVRMAQEQTVDLRASAVDALGAPGSAASSTAVLMLIGFSRHRPFDELARHADLALGEIATPAAVGALVAALRGPPVPEEARLGLLHAGAAAVEALEGEVAHGTPASAVQATRLLGEIGDRRATATLARALASPEGAAVVLVALDALARLGDPAAVPAIARAAGAPEADLRLRAFAALRALADPRGAAFIEGGLADPEPGVRAAAAALAGALVARSAAPLLADRLGDGDSAVRASAARALARTGGAPTARMLSALAATKGATRDPSELEALGDALAANVTDADAAPLAQAFLAADPAVSSGLAEPLARAIADAHLEQPLADRAVIDRAIALLEAGGPTAMAVADVLASARLSSGEVVALARAFSDADPPVRARLCVAIARTPHGGDWLASLIASPTEPLQVRAAAAWGARGLPASRPALAVAARDPEGPLATNARAALAAGTRGGAGLAAIRLRAPDGTPLAGRWVTLASDGVAVEAMTDETGFAEIDGLAGATTATAATGATWRADGLSLRAEP